MSDIISKSCLKKFINNFFVFYAYIEKLNCLNLPQELITKHLFQLTYALCPMYFGWALLAAF